MIAIAGEEGVLSIPMQMNGKVPLALYVHIPFCTRKCRYCSFYTVPYREDSIALYMSALLQEGKRKLELLGASYYVDTVFFGGGTPSLIPPHEIQRLLEELAPRAQEVSLEANPENLSKNYLCELAQTSVNRLSIGVQTFHDPLLVLLGRTHSTQKAMEGIKLACQYITNISVDLMYGLPNQSHTDAIADIQQALALPITHLSLYNLTIDPHTSFYKHRKILRTSIQEDECLAKISLMAEQLLNDGGFSRYELASYAKQSYACKHNLYYWTDRPFLGLGASASQYLYHERSKNISHIIHYLRAIKKGLSPQESSEKLPESERIKEAFALRLRLTEGACKSLFPSFLIEQLRQNPMLSSLLEENQDRIFLTRQGRLFHDSVAEEIMALDL